MENASSVRHTKQMVSSTSRTELVYLLCTRLDVPMEGTSSQNTISTANSVSTNDVSHMKSTKLPRSLVKSATSQKWGAMVARYPFAKTAGRSIIMICSKRCDLSFVLTHSYIHRLATCLLDFRASVTGTIPPPPILGRKYLQLLMNETMKPSRC